MNLRAGWVALGAAMWLAAPAVAAPDEGPGPDPRRPVAPAFSGRAASEGVPPPARPLTPALLPPIPDPALGAVEPRVVRPAARDLRGPAGVKPGTAATDDDDDLPARPGAFAPAPSKVPSTLHKQRVIAPHTTSPDLEMDISKRSTLGVFGEVGRINREDIRTNTVKEGRDLGAGVTWQYKFDSR